MFRSSSSRLDFVFSATAIGRLQNHEIIVQLKSVSSVCLAPDMRQRHSLTVSLRALGFALGLVARMGELQALSRIVSFVGVDAYILYVPKFVAKTESSSYPLPRSFLVSSL